MKRIAKPVTDQSNIEKIPKRGEEAHVPDKPNRSPRGRRKPHYKSSEKLLQRLPTPVWVVAVIFSAWGFFSANSWLTSVAILTVPVLMSLLWFQGEPPVLLFACLMQWLQASVAVFYTNGFGVSLTAAYGGPQLNMAAWLSLIGIMVLATGMRLAQFRRKKNVAWQAERETLTLRPGVILVCYLLLFAGLYFVKLVAHQLAALTQPLLALATLRWILVFLLAQSVLTRRRDYWLLGIVVCIEFATGILGYFSGFKGIFFVLLVVLPTARFIFKGWRLAQFAVVVVAVAALAIIWTVVKEEYRDFLNQGTGDQVVLVSVSDRINKLGELVGDLDRNAVEDGLEKAVLRISYVSYFAATIMYVPSQVPHESGRLWLGAVKHVLMPRFLFPNKPVINDSERVAQYTGMQVAGEEQGTSISLGYMAESYVDFGPAWMFVPVLLLGVFYGLIYRYFVYHYDLRLLGFAMATSILAFGAYTIETSNIKLVGGNVMGFIVIALFAKFVGPSFWTLISSPSNSRKRRSRRNGPAASMRPLDEDGRSA